MNSLEELSLWGDKMIAGFVLELKWENSGIGVKYNKST